MQNENCVYWSCRIQPYMFGRNHKNKGEVVGVLTKKRSKYNSDFVT